MPRTSREVKPLAHEGAASSACELKPFALETTASLQGDPPLVVELCAGSAMLSSVLRRVGFEVLPIDFKNNKHRPYVHVVSLDLTKASSWSFVRHVVEHRAVLHLHAAPPCGTAHRAREAREPPLRSDEWPKGFPWLEEEALARVENANSIYVQLASLCGFLEGHQVGFSVENPANSLLWRLPE